MFKTNQSGVDRVVRVVLGIALLALGLFWVQAPWNYILDLVGVIALVTGAIGFCPIYALLRIHTNKAGAAR
ncbi:MAG: DUF2892 domain-containing protein [Anaerolineae bacterium]